MSDETKVTTKDSKGVKNELLRLTMSSSPERGLEIFVQSRHNWSQFANKEANSMTVGGVKCFQPKNGNGMSLSGVNGQFRVEKDNFGHDGFLNLSILLAQGIVEGVTFNFGVFPITEDKITEYLNNFRQTAKIIYLTYCKPVSKSIIITTTVIETESFD